MKTLLRNLRIFVTSLVLFAAPARVMLPMAPVVIGAGCAQLAPEADPAVVRAESVRTVGHESLNQLFTWQLNNRALISDATNAKINAIKEPAKAAELLLKDLVAEYKATRSADVKTKLLAALDQYVKILAKVEVLRSNPN